jgi:Protein of unknown function (DUF2584)
MGFPLETNWYIVVKDKLPQPNIDETRDYTKEGYRDYPVSDSNSTYELPVILRGECIGMGIVTMQVQAAGKTHIKYKLIRRFEEGDAVAHHYTHQYIKAKGGNISESSDN